MIRQTSSQDGFTAVELLITLVVAALFLFAGYQLYNVILSSGTSARNQALAGSTAHNYIQQYSDAINAPCSAETPLTNSPITVDGLAEPKVTVAITCPVANAPNLSKISVTISFGIGDEATSLTRVAFKGASS